MQDDLLLVGPVPHPIGGVSQHVWRLAMRLSQAHCGVCDLYEERRKYPLFGARHHTAAGSGWRRAVWLRSMLRCSRARVVHFHFSSTARMAWVGRALLSWSSASFRVLTLHDGDLGDRHRALGRLARASAAGALRQFDRILVLSERQRAFYDEIGGIAVNRLQSGSSYIALPSTIDSICQSATKDPRSTGEIRLVASGYPEPFYGHEDAIRLTDDLRKHSDARLTLCLYGKASDNAYLRRLQALSSSRPHLRLTHDLDLAEFLQVLSKADLYLRPTLVDSYGLAIADALTLGVPVIASDVCQRPKAARVFPAGDYLAFVSAVHSVLSDLPAARRNAGMKPSEDGLPAILAAYQEAWRPERILPSASEHGQPIVSYPTGQRRSA